MSFIFVKLPDIRLQPHSCSTFIISKPESPSLSPNENFRVQGSKGTSLLSSSNTLPLSSCQNPSPLALGEIDTAIEGPPPVQPRRLISYAKVTRPGFPAALIQKQPCALVVRIPSTSAETPGPDVESAAVNLMAAEVQSTRVKTAGRGTVGLGQYIPWSRTSVSTNA